MRILRYSSAALMLALSFAGCDSGGGNTAGPVRNATGDYGSSEDRPVDTVPLSSVRVLDTVLKNSGNYTIDPEVKLDAYYYRFTVHTPHGDYDALSVRKLVKLCNEIDVLEKFRKTDHENHVWTGISQSAAGIGKGFTNLFMHPVASVKRVGGSAGKLARATGNAFKPKASKIASDGIDHSKLGAGPAGGERRLMAYQLGIDVYTDTPAVQDLLNEIARKRLAGKLPLSASVFALPGGAIFTMSLTPMGHDPSTEELIRDKSPDEMRFTLSGRYREQFNLDEFADGSSLAKLFDNPNFTPREQAYIWRYLTDMSNVGNRNEAIEFLAAQHSVERAGIVCHQLEMLSLLHQRARPLAKFVPLRNTLGALSERGTLIFVISNDTVRYWSDVKASLEMGLKTGDQTGAKRVEFWTTGDADAKTVQMANEMGIKVYQNILRNKIFQTPRSGSALSGKSVTANNAGLSSSDSVPADKPSIPSAGSGLSSSPTPVTRSAPLPPSSPATGSSSNDSDEKKSLLKTYW